MGDTILFFAIRMKNIKAVEILINKGFNVEFKNNDGDTPFHFAIKNSNTPLEIMNIFLSKTTNFNIQNNKGETLLMLTSAPFSIGDSESQQIIKILLEKGVDPNLQNNNGNTVLHLNYHNFYNSLTLVKNGAKLSILNNKKISPLSIFRAKVLVQDEYRNTKIDHENPFETSKKLHSDNLVLMKLALINNSVEKDEINIVDFI